MPKADKFARLGNARYKRCVAMIRSLGKLGTSGYERDPAKVTALASVLRSEIDAMEQKLMPRAGSEKQRETMPDVL